MKRVHGNPRDPEYQNDAVVGCPGCAPAWVTRLDNTLCADCRDRQAALGRRRRAELRANPGAAFTDPWATTNRMKRGA